MLELKFITYAKMKNINHDYTVEERQLLIPIIKQRIIHRMTKKERSKPSCEYMQMDGDDPGKGFGTAKNQHTSMHSICRNAQ